MVYAILAFGGVLGVGQRRHPLPWSVLQFDSAKNGYVAPVNKSALQNAPSFRMQELIQDDQNWRERVYAFCNITPYWL